MEVMKLPPSTTDRCLAFGVATQLLAAQLIRDVEENVSRVPRPMGPTLMEWSEYPDNMVMEAHSYLSACVICAWRPPGWTQHALMQRLYRASCEVKNRCLLEVPT